MKLRKAYKNLKVLAIALLPMGVSLACVAEAETRTQSVYELKKATALARVAVGYANVGQFDRSSHLLVQALETANSIEADLQSLILPEVAIGYAEAEQYQQAIEVVEPLQKDIYEKVALYQIIAIAIEAGDYEQALQLSKELDQSEITDEKGSQDTQAKTLLAIANTAIQTEPKDKALSILTQVLQQIETFPNSAQRSISLGEIAVNYAQVGERAKALLLLDHLLESLQTENNSFSEIDALAKIAVSYAQVGEKAKALQLLEQARQKANHSVSTLAEIGVSYAAVGEQAKASQFLEQALQAAKSVKSSDAKFNALNQVAIQYVEIGQYNQALQVVKLIDQWYPATNPQALGGGFRDPLTEIAIAYAQAGRYDEAIEFAQKVRYQSHRATALSAIAGEYARARQYEPAFEIVQGLDDVSFNGIATDAHQAHLLAEIAAQATQAESKQRAVQILEQASLIAQGIEREEDKIGALTAIAIQYDRVGQPTQALKRLDQTRRLAEAIGR